LGVNFRNGGSSPRSRRALARAERHEEKHARHCRPYFTPTVRKIAEGAYSEHSPASKSNLDPARLAILSDALEEEGCTNEAVLRHLRGQEQKIHFGAGNPREPEWMPLRGPHVQGCWALDLILGRE
jgi:hypothetical protein